MTCVVMASNEDVREALPILTATCIAWLERPPGFLDKVISCSAMDVFFAGTARLRFDGTYISHPGF